MVLNYVLQAVLSSQCPGEGLLQNGLVEERIFGWRWHHRRLARNYENTAASPKAWILIAMIRIQLRRLA
jgi:transposase